MSRLDTTIQPYNYYVMSFERNETKWLYAKTDTEQLFGKTEQPLAIPKKEAQRIACNLSLKYGTHYMCVESILPIGE